MDFFIWKENFNIGIDEIDQQHRSFLNILNDCYLQLSGNKKSVITRDFIDKLKSYAAMHFRYEEKMMELCQYIEIEQQKKQHKYFESQIAELEASGSEKREKPLDTILLFLRDWFLKHILEDDTKFAFFKK